MILNLYDIYAKASAFWGSYNNAAAVTEGSLVPLGYEQLTGLSASKGLQSIPTGARLALIQAEGQIVRWRDDGVAPTTSVGMKLLADQDFVYTGTLSALRFIELVATAKVNVSYYR